MTNIRNAIAKIAGTILLALSLTGCGQNPGLPLDQGNKTNIAYTAKAAQHEAAKAITQENAKNAKAELEAKRETWEPKIAKLQKKLDGARKYFNDSLKDGNLSVSEQREIYCQIKDAKSYLDKILYGFAKEPDPFIRSNSKYAVKYHNGPPGGGYHFEIRDSRLKIPHKDLNLCDGLFWNLYGLDFGTPELQDDLDKEFAPLGVSISVEPRFSPLERCLAGLGTLAAFGYLRKKIKRGNRK
jgi:hypothetical protein